MQRAEFLNPEVDVIKFEAEDVITSSGGLNFDPDGAGGEGGSDEGSDFDDIWG